MFTLFNNVREFWNEYSFEIMISLTIVFLISVAIYQKLNGNSGTWSKTAPKIILMDVNSNSFQQIKKKRNGSNDSKGEVECRRVLESLFNVPFNKARPDFLNNPVTGGHFNLELDCFNEDLNIAVEYNGIQHMKFVPFFHKNHEAFLNQKYRDDMKRRICKEYNIILIEVPHTVKIENIEQFLKDELKKKLRNTR